MAHNIDESSLLSYIATSFEVFGITHVKKQTLKSARDDKIEVRSSLIRLLFDLTIMHLIDYQYTMKDLGISHQGIETVEMEEFVLAHLSQINCPYLIHRYQQNNEKCNVYLDRKSSRSLLALIGWLICVSDFFNNIKKQLQKRYNALYISKQYQNTISLKKTDLNSDTSSMKTQIVTLQTQYRKLKTINYKIDCLQNKKNNLNKKLQDRLTLFNKKNKTNFTVRLEQLMKDVASDNSEEFYEKEEELVVMLKFQKQGMKNQQYFWKWLQVRVLMPYEKALAQEYADYYQQPQQLPHIYSRIRPSSDYLSKYIHAYNQSQSALMTLNEKIEGILDSLQADVKGKKAKQLKAMVNKEIQQQISTVVNEERGNQEEKEMASFLGIELKKILSKNGVKIGSKAHKKQKQVQRVGEREQVQELRHKLREQLKQFMDCIQAIKFL